MSRLSRVRWLYGTGITFSWGVHKLGLYPLRWLGAIYLKRIASMNRYLMVEKLEEQEVVEEG